MNEIFKFLFNQEVLNNTLRPEWIKLYDMTYIDTKVISNLMKNAELLSDFLNSIMIKAMGEHQLSREINNNSDNNNQINNINNSKTSNTSNKLEFKPFNLTQPKPKVIQEPIKIPNKIKVKPVPLEAFHKNSLQKLDCARKERLEIIKDNVIKKYEAMKPVELKTALRPTNIDKIAKEINEKREKELQFDKKYHIPLKDFQSIPANVKYNETAILREEFLINKKKQKEEEMLKKILVEKKDTKEFERWKREMEDRDNLLRMEEITRRKLELDLNREVATEYFNQRILQNKLEVAKHKEQENMKLQEKMEMLAEELESKKKLVKEIEKEREYVQEEREKMIQKNKENYAKQLDEYNDLVLKANEEKKIEEERRKDLIIQIRELERLPMKRTKGFDPTETPGHGLLEEMSLAELRERLETQKKFVQEFIEAKKEENRLKQTEKNEEFLERANLVMNYRDQLRNEKEIERKNKQEQKLKEKEQQRLIREKNIIEVKDKIESKKNKLKKEEEVLEKKIREIKLQRQYLQQGRVIIFIINHIHKYLLNYVFIKALLPVLLFILL